MSLHKRETVIKNHGGVLTETYPLNIKISKNNRKWYGKYDHVIEIRPYKSNTDLVEIVEYDRYPASALKIFEDKEPIKNVIKHTIRVEYIEFTVKCLKEYLHGRSNQVVDDDK